MKITVFKRAVKAAKIPVFFVFLALLALLPQLLRAQSDDLQFDMNKWKQMRREKEEQKFEEKALKEIKPEEKKKETPSAGKGLLPKAQLKVNLPAESSGELAVNGHKTINMTFGKVFYKEPDAKKRTVSAGGGQGFAMNMDQALAIKINGKVGRKISVNINYDDKQNDLNRRNISIQYKGDPDEIVQNVSFGDITLSLPGTEFVGYSGQAGLNKNLFGFMGSAKYKDMSVYFVGSQTKGRSEVKRFTGSTSFVKKQINDASYQRYKYYKIYDSASSLPIAKNSEKIWLDDKNGDNNLVGITKQMTVAWGTNTFTGNFDLLKPGIDYVVDYAQGIITFYRSSSKNYIIAGDWTNLAGAKLSDTTGGLAFVFKDDDSRVNRTGPDADYYELKNRYYLGDTNIIRDTLGQKFVIKILDNSDSADSPSGKNYVDYSSAAFTVDYDLGVVEFNNEKPFQALGQQLGQDYSDTYNSIYYGQKRHFSIYTEYRVHLNQYMLRPSIVKDSEQIMIDSKVLKKDKDYILDYYSGWLTFLNTSAITDESSIEATYEYYPFIGGNEQTFAGSRVEYRPNGNFFLGGTYLYNFSPSVGEVPSIYQTAPSTLLLDMNTSLTVSPKKYFPFKISLSGEAARSSNNPNRSGKAIVENMESVKQNDSYSTYEENWKPGAIQDASKRGELTWTEAGGIKMRDLNPGYYNSDDETTALLMAYSDMSASGQTALAYSISNEGVDYSNKKYFDAYVWGSGKSEKLDFEFGQFNEDADGDGAFDKEDTNDDGYLNENEDTGVVFNGPGWTQTWGADNGRLDTEDLDGDNIMNTIDKVVYSTSVVVSWTGWRRIRMKLPITSSNIAPWRSVKQLRMTIERDSSGPASGSLMVSEIGMVGNKWETGALSNSGDTFQISAINNESDPEYTGKSLLTTPYYNEIYQTSDTDIKEQALRVSYSLSANATGYAYASYSRMDMTLYKSLHYFVYGFNTGSRVFVRIGNDVNNYYETSFIDNFSGWSRKSISFDDDDYDSIPDGFDTVAGNVNLNNITRIFVGVRSGSLPSSGEIWFDDFYVDNVRTQSGSAQKARASVELPGWMSVNGTAKHLDSTFKSMTFASPNEQEEWNAGVNINRFHWLPLSGRLSRSVVKTPRENVNLSGAPMAQYLSSWDEGKVIKHSYSGNAGLNIRYLPQLSGSYSHSVTSATLLGKTDTADSWTGKMTYTLPNLLILPQNISANYSKSDSNTAYRNELKLINYGNISETYGATAGFAPFRFININCNGNYSRSKAGKAVLDNNKKLYLPQADNLTAGMTGNFRPMNWFNLNFNYNSTIAENYQQPSSTTTWADGVKLKDINRSASAGASMPFKPSSLFSFGPTNSLAFSYSTKLTDADVYKSVDKDFYALNKIFLRDSSFNRKPLAISTSTVPDSYSTKKDDTITASYKPFAFLKLSGGWTPLSTIDLQLNHTQSVSRTQASGGTLSMSRTKTWPDARMRISSLEKLPVFTKNFSSVSTLLSMNKTETLKRGISRNNTDKYGVSLNFNYRKLVIATNYNLTRTGAMNLQQNVLQSHGTNQTWNMNFNFSPWNKWHSNFSYSGTKNLAYSAGGVLSADARTHTVTSKFNSDTVKLRKTIKFPFSKKKTVIDQNVRYNFDLSAALNLSSLNVVSTNYQLYKSNFSMNFDMSSNFTWSLGAGASYANYTKYHNNNYLAVNINTKLEIIF